MVQPSDIVPSREGASVDEGRVALGAPLGEGGMGSVFRGRLRGHDAPVAVKVLRCDGLDPAARLDLAARLSDEAVAAARVVHPNLVRVLAAGACPAHGPYVVFELVEGGTLTERLARGPLPWEEVEERLAPHLLGALGALHAAGVVHRDVKPDNVFVTPDGRYLLGDLGLAVFEGRSAATATGVVVGTPGYLAPERITRPDFPSSPAADVYAAAMVLLRAAGGRLPFRASAPAALVAEQVRWRPSPRSLQALGLPREASRVLAAALDPDPDVRPASAADLLTALAKASREASTVSRRDTLTRTSGVSPRVTRPTRSVVGPAPVIPGAPRHRVTPLGFLLSGALVFALAAVGIHLSPGPVPESSVPGPSAAADHGLAVVQAAVVAARPLIPDEAVRRLDGAADPAVQRAVVRAVNLAAGSTSPGAVAFRVLAEGAGPRTVLAEATAYARALSAASPEQAAAATLLLTDLLARLAPMGPAWPTDVHLAEALDALSLTVFDLLAHLPPSVRSGPPGRSLAVALDLLLASATEGGLPGPAREWLPLVLASSGLAPSVRSLGASLGLTLPPRAEPEAVWSVFTTRVGPLAVEAPRAAFVRLDTDKANLAWDATQGMVEDLRARVAVAAAQVVEEWYRLLPAELLPPGESGHSLPTARDARLRLGIMVLGLLKVGRVSNRQPEHAGVVSGPFRPCPLAGRLALVARERAERAVAGSRADLGYFVRDVEALVDALAALPAFGPSGASRAASFLDPIESILAGAPSCLPALLVLRGVRALTATGEAAEPDRGRRLFIDAAEAALRAIDVPPARVEAHELRVLRYSLGYMRRRLPAARDEERWRQVQDRAMRTATGLRASPDLASGALVVLDPLIEALGRSAFGAHIDF